MRFGYTAQVFRKMKQVRYNISSGLIIGIFFVLAAESDNMLKKMFIPEKNNSIQE